MNVAIDNKIVAYSKHGTIGKRLLCLHGWGSDKHAFKKLSDTLAGTYRLVSVDLPGFGSSELPDSAWGISEYADFVKKFTNKIDFQPDVVIGHSMGGRIAVYIAGQQVLDFDKLVLLGAHGFDESKNLRNKAYKMLAKTGKLAAKPLTKKAQTKLRKKLYKSAGAEDYLNSDELQETFKKIISFDLSEIAMKISKPTLIIYGEDDQNTPVSYGRQYKKLISDSSLHIIDGAGHYVQNDATKKVAELIKNFI